MIALPLPFPDVPAAAPARPAPSPPAPRAPTIPAPTLRAPTPSPAPSHLDRASARRRALWLGVHLLDWPLRAALSALTDDERALLETKPLAVVDGDRRNTLVTCNEVASAVGVRPGHSMNAAIALCADLRFLPRHATHERALLDEIAGLCQRYTSAVSVEAPNELLLEVRGSLRLFGGVRALMSRVRADLRTHGLHTQLALSATAQSAQWLARTAREPIAVPPRDLVAALSAQPISVLLWPTDVELRLRRFGVVSVGDLLRLPRDGLARRIGPAYLAALDRAVGRRPEVRREFRALETYEDHLVLDFEIETTSLLSVVIERRMARLQRFLTRRNVTLDQIAIDLEHRERACTAVPIGLANSTADMAHVTTLMREHLARLQLPAPVVAVRLRVATLHGAQVGTGDLFLAKGRPLDASAAQARLLERLRARLGHDAIHSLAAHADHRPERAHRLVAATPQAMEISYVPPSVPRPLWLLPSPRRIRALEPERDRLIGPEKIESGWWDEQLAIRDYYRARAARGALGWVYRDGERVNEWQLHGLFG